MTGQPPASLSPAQGDVLLLVGTVKGNFIFSSDAARSTGTLHGPHFPGESVYPLAYDERGERQRTLAATRSFHWGSTIRTSDDHGATWSGPERQSVRFPEHRKQWQPGGGLCLHTILPDPANDQRMLIAMSTGGCYRTDDGGKSWRARNVGVRAQFLPNKYPEFGQCAHKVVHHLDRPERLFLQNHWGLYRSDDWGDHWTDIANGVPSDFGFAMQMHPHDPDTVYIVPIKSDEFRITPDAKLRLYRTRNAGDSWEPLENGLPQHDAYETIVRDALGADSDASCGRARCPLPSYCRARSIRSLAAVAHCSSTNDVLRLPTRSPPWEGSARACSIAS